jgi:hypothetical protein
VPHCIHTVYCPADHQLRTRHLPPRSDGSPHPPPPHTQHTTPHSPRPLSGAATAGAGGVAVHQRGVRVRGRGRGHQRRALARLGASRRHGRPAVFASRGCGPAFLRQGPEAATAGGAGSRQHTGASDRAHGATSAGAFPPHPMVLHHCALLLCLSQLCLTTVSPTCLTTVFSHCVSPLHPPAGCAALASPTPRLGSRCPSADPTAGLCRGPPCTAQARSRRRWHQWMRQS